MAVWMGALLIFLICIDMGVKQYIEDTFKGEEERDTRIPRIVLRKVHNKGFLLNVLEKRPEIVRMGSVGCRGICCTLRYLDVLEEWKILSETGHGVRHCRSGE